jgi:hypothetical protein
MDRSNHYEAAFEAWLQDERLCYIAVDETRRCVLGDSPVKSLDFVVYGPAGARLVVDVKGRRFPGGPPGRPRRVWENWSTEDDINGLSRWAERFGPGYQGLLVFAYHVLPEVALPEDTEGLFFWRRRRYLLRGIDVDDYRRHLRVRSPRWGTVSLPGPVFRELVRPVQHFTHGPALVPAECPF